MNIQQEIKNHLQYEESTGRFLFGGNEVLVSNLLDEKLLLMNTLGPEKYLVLDSMKKVEQKKILKEVIKYGNLRKRQASGDIGFEETDPVEKYIVLLDQRTGMFHTVFRKDHKLSPISGKVLVENKLYPRDEITPVITHFDPTRDEVMWNESGEIHFNLYQRPEWYAASPIKNDLPIRFIEHFFPDKKHRTWFLAWFKQALFGRNETIPIILERQGNGKNSLVEGILFPMIGYSHLASQSLLNNKVFNAELVGKRCVFYDEIALPKSSVNRLKSYTNSRVTIERKGAEVINARLNCNFIGAGNLSEGRLYTTADERRLSFLDSVTTKLEDTFSHEEIEYLRSGFYADLGAQRYLYEWLMEQDLHSVDIWKPLKGKKYYKCFFNSQDPLFRTFIYEFMLKDKTVDYKQLVRGYQQLGGTTKTMQHRLIDHIRQNAVGGVMACTFEYENEKSNLCTFVPNPKFVEKFNFLLEEELRAKSEKDELIDI